MSVLNYLFAALILLISFIYWYVKSAFSYWRSKGVPHEEPDIPYGNIKNLGKTTSFLEFTQNYYNRFKGQSKICGMYLFTRPIAILLDLELIKHVLIKDFAAFNDRGLYYNDKDDPLSAHLVALNGVKWKNVRIKLTPTFTSGKMKYMYSTITKIGDRLNEYVGARIAENDELEMKSILAKFTMDVIGTCAFGIECNTLNDKSNDFYKMGRTAMENTRHDQRFAFLLNDVTFAPWARFFGVKSIRDDVSDFFMGVVKCTIDYREKNNIERNDFMDLLIKLKTGNNDGNVNNGLTVNEIAAQSFLFFAAGYETSSTTMLFALYELALNPDIQSKLRMEIQKAFKMHKAFTYEMMMDIPYLDQTINETLRKYPPFTTLRRMTQSAYKIPGTDVVLDRGVSVIVPVHAIQNDPEYFPEPDKFDPQRFEPEETKKRNPMTWLPFGEGPRNCIAQRFGMMQTRIGLIHLLINYEFSVCDNTPIPMVFGNNPIVLSAKEGIYLKIKRYSPGHF